MGRWRREDLRAYFTWPSWSWDGGVGGWGLEWRERGGKWEAREEMSRFKVEVQVNVQARNQIRILTLKGTMCSVPQVGVCRGWQGYGSHSI